MAADDPQVQSKPNLRLDLPICAGLLVLNLVVAGRLLYTEYLVHYGSIEPIFFAIARYLQAHWQNPGWYSLWSTGMPFEYTYQPLLHYLTAFTSWASGWSIPRAFHFVFAIGYAFGPITLYFLVLRLGKRRDAALLTGLLYSLWSPSLVLVWQIARDVGTYFGARRLHTAAAYGDSPHVFGLTFLPLALLAIDRVVEKRTLARWVTASLCTIAVVLTNVPATISLAMALIAYVLTGALREWPRRALIAFFVGLTGYALVAVFLPPSGLIHTFRNTQLMDSREQLAGKGLVHLSIGVVVLAASWILSRTVRNPLVRFSVIFFLPTSAVVLGFYWLDYRVMNQALRFHLTMEIPVVILTACVLAWALRSLPSGLWRYAAICILAIAAVWQFDNYHYYARKLLERGRMDNRSEYTVAKWFDENAQRERVYAPGSVAFWMNTFTDTPQLSGCCDQNVLFQGARFANYIMGSDDGAEDRAAEISRTWLIAMGVRYAAMPTPNSDETFGIRHPDKFEGVLRKVWSDGKDTIYEVHRRPHSLAHWVAPSELIPRAPQHGVDVEPLQKYVDAISDPARGSAEFRWVDTQRATIAGVRSGLDVLSVQVPYHFGWRADGPRGRLPVERDGMGFLVIRPDCEGPCNIQLTFDGGKEKAMLRIVTASAWMVVLFLFGRHWYRKRRSGPLSSASA